jgi:hypothetical protein
LLLLPRQPLVVNVRPYEVYDIYVPVDSLAIDSDHWIKASYEGGLAIEINMKRKAIETDSSEEPNEESDFNKRYSRQLKQGLGLRDHRYAFMFQLDSRKRYTDDTEMKQFEIATGVDGKEYLAFTLSVFERAHSYDEALIFETCELSLRLMPNTLDSFSAVDSLVVSVGNTLIVLAAFLAIIYKKVMPRDAFAV